MTEQIISTVTREHSIEVVDGHLTIEGDQKTLTPEETEQLLDVLLIWRYGLEAVALETLEDYSCDRALFYQTQAVALKLFALYVFISAHGAKCFDAVEVRFAIIDFFREPLFVGLDMIISCPEAQCLSRDTAKILTCFRNRVVFFIVNFNRHT